ncbi:membrane-bound alkaline phosphatase [Glossina fuscipes]|uniref:Alkaline phosphatase n=1 Tax=Glossina fuscipes TaxID=7396 RepID=A0A9C6DZZ7_9MUSC|nr:membrane-bound alkaline phosphatase [Glossina fuscipes]
MGLQILLYLLIALLIDTARAADHFKYGPSRKYTMKNMFPEHTTEYWNERAQDILKQKLVEVQSPITNNAKNIIMFLGDGMSVHTITATRNFMGDSAKQVSFEKFPYFGLSKTYCVDSQVADSACSATAYLGGVKGNYGTIGVNANVPRFDCMAGLNVGNWVESIAQWAQNAGMDTGLVTTSRVTHASPAGVYAHTAQRGWENDAEILKSGCSSKVNVDIARQLVEWPVGRKLKVIMGGGRSNFRNITVNDEDGIAGQRYDGRDLIEYWIQDKRSQNVKANYVWNRKGLNSLNLNNTDYLLGLFSSSHCPFHGDLKRNNISTLVPSLSEMTEFALKVLSKKNNGFFLFVESARIDMAHHETKARKSLEDTEELAKAVDLTRKMFSEEDTLIIVTSDHSHTMTISGYPYRDEDITGLAADQADDDLPYTILSYANGPGFDNTYNKKGRKRIAPEETIDPNFQYLATVPLASETHGGDDVGVFASGPFAHYFSGTYEQCNIPAMMAKAANIGTFRSGAGVQARPTVMALFVIHFFIILLKTR